jgi:hypothetical protein
MLIGALFEILLALGTPRLDAFDRAAAGQSDYPMSA